MPRLMALLALLMIPAASAAGDVVHLRDGTTVEGKVTSCDDTGCRIDARRVPRAEIVRITLFPAAQTPRLRSPGIVFKDGTVRRGLMSAMSLGTVELPDGEIDRDEVAEIILAANNEPRDVLITVDGRSSVGKLTTCNAASCTFADETIPLQSVVWIGLRQEGEVPPSAPNADLIFTAAESPVPARLAGLDTSTVRTTRGRFPRDEVRWIRLEPHVESPPPGPPIYLPTPPPPPAPYEPTPPPPPEPVPDTPTVTRRLWVGKLIGRMWNASGGERLTIDVEVDVRLREHVLPLHSDPPSPKKIGEVVFLNEEGTIIRNKYRQSMTGETCSGQGAVTVMHPAQGYGTSVMYRRTAAGPARLIGFDIPAERPVYLLAIGAYYPPSVYEVTCSGGGESRTFDYSFLVPMAGTLPSGTVSFDPIMRHLEDNRMIGSYRAGGGDTFEHSAVSWAICLEGTRCPPPEPLDRERRRRRDPPVADVEEDDDEDDCTTSVQRDLLETALRERKLKFEQLKRAYEKFKEVDTKLRNSKNNFDHAARDCDLSTIARLLTSLFVNRLGSSGPAQTVGAIDTVLGVVEGVLEDDPSWILPDLDVHGIDPEIAWGTFSLAYQELQSSNASPAQLRTELVGCGALRLPINSGILEGALTYLSAAEEIKPLADGMNTLRNSLHRFEAGIIANQWPKYQRECRRSCAEGGDVTVCDQLPPVP